MVGARSRAAAYLAPGLVAAASAIVLLAGTFTWLDIAGDELSGFRLADLVLSLDGAYSVSPPSWIGFVWYLLPAAAALNWVVLFASWPVRITRWTVWLMTLQTVVIAAVALAASATAQVAVGTGVWLAVGGLALGWGGVGVDLLSRRLNWD
jgi:hypothetical protein